MRFFQFIHTALFWASFVFSLLCVTASASVDLYAPYGALVVLAAIAVGYFAPLTGCSLALISLPFAGNRPGTTQALFSLLVGASLFVGMSIRSLVGGRASLAKLSKEELRNPLIFIALLYVFFSAASLLSVPLNHALDEIRNSTSRESFKALAFSLNSLIFTNEHTFVFSYLSVYYTALSYLLGVSIFRLCRAEPTRAPRLLIGSVFIGVLLSLLIGIGDYYRFIDLTTLRGLDPIVNPGGEQFRLQSLFGHSGWYAEYLTLAIPTGLVILSLRMPFWARAVAILFALTLGEFVLILTYQRGGWISYPLTLCAVWAAIYVVRLLEKGEHDIASALRRSSVKVLISLPLTIAASLALVVLFQGRNAIEGATSSYVSRFKDIQRTGDRTDFLKAGALIGSLHPILGAGSDSFAWQFEREIESPAGHFPGRFILPLHGSAHNVYAQTFSGKGLCGLLTLIALPCCLIVAAFQALRNRASDIDLKLIVLTGACFGCAFLIYGNVQEVFYIQALQYLFFAIIGVVAAVAFRERGLKEKNIIVMSWVCCLVVAGHLAWEFGVPGTTRNFYQEKRLFGCFPEEGQSGGATYRWCGERGRIALPVVAGASALQLTVEAGPLAQTITFNSEDTNLGSVTLSPGEKKDVTVAISSKAQGEGRATIRFTAASSFVPKLLWARSSDMRRLAFRLAPR